VVSDGSPPHARGKGIDSRIEVALFRFTPARAGKGKGWPPKRFRCSVHPRTRGERYGWKPRTHHRKSFCGKSTDFFPQEMSIFTRSKIPHAGALRRVPRQAIKRMDGEGQRLFRPLERPPPHPIPAVGDDPDKRSPPTNPTTNIVTPARAGKGSGRWKTATSKPVHPRMRGERAIKHFVSAENLGSPPHARGKGSWRHRGGIRTRFTPACAGKGARAGRPSGIGPVHPRTRGERIVRYISPVFVCGSPPHARGKVDRRRGNRRFPRFTPARAGKGSRDLGRAASRAVHPRTRGERVVGVGAAILGIGSPPHARGKGLGKLAGDRLHRFTPARAGKGMAGSHGRIMENRSAGSPPTFSRKRCQSSHGPKSRAQARYAASHAKP
jgi:hypothetical protein